MHEVFSLSGRETPRLQGQFLIEGEKDPSHSSDRFHILG
jgi:hypothetical protein